MRWMGDTRMIVAALGQVVKVPGYMGRMSYLQHPVGDVSAVMLHLSIFITKLLQPSEDAQPNADGTAFDLKHTQNILENGPPETWRVSNHSDHTRLQPTQ